MKILLNKILVINFIYELSHIRNMVGWSKVEPSCVVDYKIYYDHDFNIYDTIVSGTRTVIKSKCSRCSTIKQHMTESSHNFNETTYKE